MVKRECVSTTKLQINGVVAQKVEQRIETPCADGSIPFPYH